MFVIASIVPTHEDGQIAGEGRLHVRIDLNSWHAQVRSELNRRWEVQ